MRKIIETKNAPAPIGPYNQAIQAGNTLYISGQIPINPITGELEMASLEDETNQVMKNIGAILKEAGSNFEHVVKCTIFVKSMDFYGIINPIYASYFNEAFAPAREFVAVAGLPKNVNVEISTIAIVPE